MTELVDNSNTSNINFSGYGMHTFAFNLPPFTEGTYQFDITEGNGQQLYFLVFPR